MSAAQAANFKITNRQEGGQKLDGDNQVGEVTASGKIILTLRGHNRDVYGIDHTRGKGVVITVKGEVLGSDDYWGWRGMWGTKFASIPIKSAGDGVRINIIGNRALIRSRDRTWATHGISSAGNDAQITQSGGRITTQGGAARGISSEGNNAQITQSGGEITTQGLSACLGSVHVRQIRLPP